MQLSLFGLLASMIFLPSTIMATPLETRKVAEQIDTAETLLEPRKMLLHEQSNYNTTLVARDSPIRINPSTYCDSHKKGGPNYTSKKLDKLLKLWYTEFGYEGGILHHGYFGRPTYQAVCCGRINFCLYVEHDFDENDYEWDQAGWEYAIEELRRSSEGFQGCTTPLFTKKGSRAGALTLKMVPAWDHKIAWQSEHVHHRKDSAIDLFADTCKGWRGYNGPDW